MSGGVDRETLAAQLATFINGNTDLDPLGKGIHSDWAWRASVVLQAIERVGLCIVTPEDAAIAAAVRDAKGLSTVTDEGLTKDDHCQGWDDCLAWIRMDAAGRVGGSNP